MLYNDTQVDVTIRDTCITTINEWGWNMKILTVNAGSSSVKLALFENDYDNPVLSVSIENIGTAETASLIPSGQYGSNDTNEIKATNHREAIEAAVEWLHQQAHIDGIDAIGHRVVHGGTEHHRPARIDDELMEYLHSITPLAPNHMHPSLSCIEALRTSYPESVHVATFDTGFFKEVPTVARTLALPRELRDQGIQRYGFHGLSYEYLLDNFGKTEGEEAKKGRVIIAHLGSGASISAIKDGKPLDMSMGFTPASGIIMSTRSGDIDPGVIDYLLAQGKTREEIQRLLYKESGLLGLSENTADMYTLLQSEATDERARLAIEVFCYTIRKTIGAYSAVLGGVDSIIFAAGIGERSAEIRARVCEPLAYLGVEIDKERNENGERLISTDDSTVGVHVIHTHEDRIIAVKTHDVAEKVA